MKKLIIIGIAIAALLAAFLTGTVFFFRNNTPTDPVTTVPAPTTTAPQTSAAPTTTLPPADIQLRSPTVSISLPIIRETDTADDTREIFQRTFQDVVLNISNAAIAKNVTLDILQRMDRNSALLSTIQSNAYLSYNGQDNWVPYYYKLLYSPQRIDPAVLSLFGQETSYGGAQSSHVGISVNYNLLTGTVLKLSDVLTESSTTYDNLLSALLDALAGKKAEYMLFEYYADAVKARFPSDLQSETNWFFSTEGLCVYYAPYEIAPNASGIVVATIPYESLSGILLGAYFPAEQAEFPHGISGIPFASADLTQFDSFCELVTDPDAPQYILSTNGVLYDVTIESGNRIGTTRFESEAVMFRANHLSPADALMLRAELPTENGSLLLSYRSGGNVYRYYLTQDAVTGNVTFVPAN